MKIFDKNKIENFLFVSLAKFFNLFGFDRAWFFAKILAFLFYYMVPVRKDVVFKNLRIAFPEYPDEKIKKIAKSNYYIFCKTLIEIMCIPSLTKESILDRIESDKAQLLKERYNGETGMIFLTGHFSNYELTAIYGSIYLGAPMHVLIKPQRNPYVSDWLNRMRESFGNKIVPLGVSVRNIIKVLKENGIVGIVADQRGPADSPRVKLFGVNTALYTGTASLAIKLKVPVYVGFLINKGRGRFNLEIEEIDISKLSGSFEDQINAFNQSYMDILEKNVRRNPDHWFWMHNIWKY